MQECKLVKVPIPVGVKLSLDQCPKTQKEDEDMSRVPYASVVGSLIYAMVYTRPYIAHAVGVLSKYMSKPGNEHWREVKRVFRYLRGTTSYGLCYQGRPRLDRVLDIHGFFFLGKHVTFLPRFFMSPRFSVSIVGSPRFFGTWFFPMVFYFRLRN
jgi:hypothetical protein